MGAAQINLLGVAYTASWHTQAGTPSGGDARLTLAEQETGDALRAGGVPRGFDVTGVVHLTLPGTAAGAELLPPATRVGARLRERSGEGPRLTAAARVNPQRDELADAGSEIIVLTVYDPATGTCTPALLHTGQPAGHPNDAFDTTAIIHLADYQK